MNQKTPEQIKADADAKAKADADAKADAEKKEKGKTLKPSKELTRFIQNKLSTICRRAALENGIEEVEGSATGELTLTDKKGNKFNLPF